MQFNRYIALPKSSLVYHRLFFVFRVLIFLVVAYFLWQSMMANKQILVNLATISIDWQLGNGMLFIGVIILLPINWLLESLKWQRIAGDDNNLTLLQSVKGVMLGLTLDNILPAGSGAVTGRVLTVANREKLKVVPGIFAGQISQSVITFLFGLYGFWLVWQEASTMFHWHNAHSLVLIIALAIIALIAFFWHEKIRQFLKPLKNYSPSDFGMIIFYSLARYVVFLTQFIMLAYVFSPALGIGIIIGCATWMFAARTFMPKVSNLERLGIRALAVVFFMELFSLPSAGLLLAVICLWIINLLIPSIAGLIMLKNLKTSTIIK